LAEVADRSSIMVHHGGIGTIEACLALGRPQVLVPRHLEQSLNCATLSVLGNSLRLSPSFLLSSARSLLIEAAHSKRLAQKAIEIAEKVSQRPLESLDRIIAECDDLAGLSGMQAVARREPLSNR